MSGRGIGSKQTVPTLNLATAAEVIPARGVYVTRTRDLETGREWNSLTNIGYRPTFGASDQLSIETFLLDTPPGPGSSLGRLPGRLRVEFLWRVRDERTFDSPPALKAQILKDARAAQRYFRRAKAWIGRPERRMPIGHFLLGVFSIILIDLLLAGDNALVIAMAVRSLPRRERRIGTACGAAVAVLLRIALTIFAARLLRIPYVQLAGGLFIVWIAVKVLVDASDPPDSAPAPKRLLQAIWYVVFADLTMSTDNILAIAGASKGSVRADRFRPVCEHSVRGLLQQPAGRPDGPVSRDHLPGRRHPRPSGRRDDPHGPVRSGNAPPHRHLALRRGRRLNRSRGGGRETAQPAPYFAILIITTPCDGTSAVYSSFTLPRSACAHRSRTLCAPCTPMSLHLAVTLAAASPRLNSPTA